MAEKWVKELKDVKVVDAIKVDTTKNQADMLTKCTLRNTLEGLLQDIAKSIAKQWIRDSAMGVHAESDLNSQARAWA